MRPPNADSVDTILDSGAEGLRYFEVFLPRYREWAGQEPAGGGYYALLRCMTSSAARTWKP